MKTISLSSITNFFVLVFTLLAFTSCTKDFDELNEDPIRPSKVNQGNLLGQVEYRMVNATIAMSKSFTHELMQVTAPRESSSGGTHRYEVTPTRGTSFWESSYGRITDLNDLENLSKESNQNYQAVALVLKAWVFSILTDAFGPVPFSEAGRAPEGIITPRFDQQKDIYVELLAMLDRANSLIKEDEGLVFGGDIIYGNDKAAMTKWKKLVNSLRLRLLLRIINRDGEIDVKGQIQTMLADKAKYPLFESNGDEAILRYTGVYPYYNPYYNARTLDWRQGDYYTSFHIDPMIKNEDPRLPVWATKVDVNGKPGYSGIESGYPADVSYVTDKNSSYNDNLKTSLLLGLIMTYSELEFIRAELALRGFNTGASAKEHYNNGILASLKQWEVTVDAALLTKEGILYKEGGSFEQQLEQIITQKYYAFYFVDMQSWFEKKRTGYPVLPRGKGIPVENVFPSRLLYPTYLQSLNNESLQEAIQSLGGKDVSTIKGWWDAK